MFLLSSFIFILINLFHVSSTIQDDKFLNCQDERDRLLPVATLCEDDRKDCEIIFKGFAHDYFRPYLCDKIDMKQKSLQCAKTCGFCCKRIDYEYDNSACKFLSSNGNCLKKCIFSC